MFEWSRVKKIRPFIPEIGRWYLLAMKEVVNCKKMPSNNDIVDS